MRKGEKVEPKRLISSTIGHNKHNEKDAFSWSTDINELAYNELGYNELGYNELGYKKQW